MFGRISLNVIENDGVLAECFIGWASKSELTDKTLMKLTRLVLGVFEVFALLFPYTTTKMLMHTCVLNAFN